MPPVRPSDFLAIVNKPEYSLGTKIINTYVRLPILMYKLYKYMTVDGTIASSFEEDICAVNCEEDETTTPSDDSGGDGGGGGEAEGMTTDPAGLPYWFLRWPFAGTR